MLLARDSSRNEKGKEIEVKMLFSQGKGIADVLAALVTEQGEEKRE